MRRNKLALAPRKLIFKGKSYRNRQSPYPSVSEENIVKLLRLNRHVESLEFEKNSLEHVRFLPVNGIYLQNLKHLDITLSDNKIFNEKHLLLQIGKMQMPNLTKVKLDSRILALVFDQHENESFYLHLFQFLAMLKSALKILEFANNFMLFPFLPQGALTLPLAPHDLRVLKQDLAEIQLEEFTFLFTGHEGTGPYNLGFHLLEHQTHLTKLEIDVPFGSDHLYNAIRQAVDRNASTLRHFALHSCMFLENIIHIEETFRSLSSCLCLEFLRLRKYKITNLPSGLHLPNVKYFEAVGDLSPNILLQIRTALPVLKELKFWHMISISLSQNEELVRCLRLVLDMPYLQSIRCYLGGGSLRRVSLMIRPGIVVRRSHPRHRFYLINIKR